MKNESIQVNNSLSLVKLDKYKAKHVCSIDLKENESNNEIINFLVSCFDENGCYLHLISLINNDGSNCNNSNIKAELIGEILVNDRKFNDILDLKISKRLDVNEVYCVLYDKNSFEFCLIKTKINDNKIVVESVLFSSKSQFSFFIDITGKLYVSTNSEILIYENDQVKSQIKIDDIVLRDRNQFICSSISQFNLNQIVISINNQILTMNLSKLMNEEQNSYKIHYNAHNNRIICLKHLKLKAYLFCTSSMDNKIKFWDSREIQSIFLISSMPHWALDFNFHPTYNRLMLISCSSALVRLIVFESEDPFDSNISIKEINNDLNEISKKVKPNILVVDYNEFDETVFSSDWSEKDQWMFAGVSCNGTVHINKIPEDIKFKVLIDSH